MLAPNTVRDYVKAQPFRPFRVHTASGQDYEDRHPEMIKILKNYVLIFSSGGDTPEFPDEFHTVSLMMAESISHLETRVGS